MLRPPRVHLYRIPPLRPLRPPNPPIGLRPQNRIFTTRSPLLLISNAGPRPQVPFLNSSFASKHAFFRIRPLSTEQKASIRYQLRLGVYWSLMGWLFIGGCAVCYYVLRQDWLDQKYPSPADWHWIAKSYWRSARHEEEEDTYGEGLTDWAIVGSHYIPVWSSCEGGMDFKWKTAGLETNTNWDRTIPGVDIEDIEREPVSHLTYIPVEKIGYDASSMSEEFRRGYFHSLMAMAKVAEMSFDLVRDKKRHILWPRDQVIGPSNPYPKPIWNGSPPAPHEEDTETAYDSSDLWYTRILTTGGLSRDQRITAALAYASWAQFSGNNIKAKALLSWSLKLAASAHSTPETTTSTPSASSSQPAAQLVDQTTGVIPPTAPYTTKNILSVSTAIASYHARTGSMALSLSIYLSILRARRASPSAPQSQQYPPVEPDLSLTTPQSIFRWLRAIPFKHRMPAPPPPSDLPFMRTAASSCEDAAMMNYIGEILFASATGMQGRREALSWTRDAVGIAEGGLADRKLVGKQRRVCTQCLGSGLENWHKMVAVFAREEEEMKVRRKQSIAGTERETAASEKSWWHFWSLSASSSSLSTGGQVSQEEEGQWAKEEQMLSAKRAMFNDAKMMAQLNRHISKKSKMFVM